MSEPSSFMKALAAFRDEFAKKAGDGNRARNEANTKVGGDRQRLQALLDGPAFAELRKAGLTPYLVENYSGVWIHGDNSHRLVMDNTYVNEYDKNMVHADQFVGVSVKGDEFVTGESVRRYGGHHFRTVPGVTTRSKNPEVIALELLRAYSGSIKPEDAARIEKERLAKPPRRGLRAWLGARQAG